MIYSSYATKYTREHQAGKKNPSNEPYVSVGISAGRGYRKALWRERMSERGQS